MLGKLMKYEIKATGRILIPLYAVLLVFATINKIFLETNLSSKLSNLGLRGFSSIPFILSTFAYGCTMAAVVIVTFFVIIQRFYKNLLGDEGYLMNTLPVTTITNITSKLSIATFWLIISGLVAILSIIIMAFNPNTFNAIFNDIPRALSETYKEFGFQMAVVIIEVLVAILISIIKSLTMIYSSISIGHLFSRHRILSSFGAFIVLNIISGAISSFIFIALSIIGQTNTIRLEPHSILTVHTILIFIILYNLIFFIGYFIITHYILKNKLNLE
ncbi:ABC transporter permease [Clostridium sp.]|uniref:ABC transporter permease n=1 Tax=Clostridium sp. TaxID=1506 RepID=UPI00261262E6|nr:ABC transporter permease [Clostridium sp.]